MDRSSQPHESILEPLNSGKWPGLSASSQDPYPTPISFSPAASTTVSQPIHPNGSFQSISGPAPGSNLSKVAIPRLTPADVSHGRRRSARACEPCRQRKIKCDGVRPSCSQCSSHKHQCFYEDVKRVRDQKRLGSLAKRVEAYESLLRDLESEVDLDTARKIRETMKNPGKPPPKNDDGSDSDASIGSLEAIDQVDEDLNRNEGARAAGFFGKNSEIQWMHRLETGANTKTPPHSDGHQEMPFSQDPQYKETISTSAMDYHLDNLDIPLVEPCDPLAVPPRELCDRYLDAFQTYVHPTFSAIRLSTFISQYQRVFNNTLPPPRKWLAILNMILAIGCRYTRLIDDPGSNEEDLLYLTRARHLGLHSKVLFEHTDLQQIQLELLVAIYLLCVGQINRASKFSNMALRSSLSLGINLRLTDNQTPNAAKEARGRLWWSIYSMEHLLASMTGRASCVSDSLCSVPTPLPCEEESFNHSEANRLFQDITLRESQLCPTLFEHSSHLDTPAWVSTWSPCPSLFFQCLVDLNLITHALLNKVYSIEGLRTRPSQIEHHLQKFGVKMDRWLLKLPPFYQFTLREAGPWQLDHAKLDNLNAVFVRDRVCLAMTYYSARITLCRPCLTHIYPQSSHNSSPNLSPRAKLRIDMATNCLQASCAMISILPEEPNMPWLARTAPWWAVLHYLMQATTALLLGISHCSPSESNSPQKSPNDSLAKFGSPPQPTMYPPLLETDLDTAIESTRKAMRWLYAISSIDPAARRAFVFCERIVKRVAPGFGIDLRSWPDGSSFVEAIGASWDSNGNRRGHGHRANDDFNGNGNENGRERSSDGGSGMEAFEELVDLREVHHHSHLFLP